MLNRIILIISGLCCSLSIIGQEVKDSKQVRKDTTKDKNKFLSEITVVGRHSRTDIHQMPEIVGTSIYAGKKNSLIVLDNVQGNVVTNNMRQVMAKVPGIHIWESDGSGIQIGVSARGLSPNRSWEFNTRQNGYDIAADPFGYPEAYYNPQLQAVQRIEIVRGQGSLQYGPQFGGMINYILRNGSEINKPFEFETQQTIGSNGLFNSYNAVGGKTNKFNYYAFLDHRNADGWRQNSRYYTNAGFGTFTYRFNEKFSLTAEFMHSHIRSQQPGGLVDTQLKNNTQESFRSRNWFDITWKTAAVIGNYRFSDKARMNIKVFGVFGDRNSVGYLKAITVKDSINPATLQYNNRTVDIDNYRNFCMEARYLGDYSFGNMKNTFSAGTRLYTGTTSRFRDGKGTTDTEYDITRVDGIWPKDIDFISNNAAVFAENIFRISDKFLIIPGVRYEYLLAKASGRNGYDNNSNEILLQNEKRGRGFLLAGIGSEYHISNKTEVYGNITQAYRPIQFGDLTSPPTTDVVDPDISDAKGYNIDLGYRGKIKDFLFFDLSGFYLQYNNRIGSITQQNIDNSFYNFRTNVGNSTSKGFEGLVEFSPVKAFCPSSKSGDISLFVSYSYTDARYGNFKVVSKNNNNELIESNLKDKKVENAPQHILRSGMTYRYKEFMLTGQLSYVDKAYSDANNTVVPSSNGQNGLIPSYTVADITASYRFTKVFNIKAGINNIFDERYFTRRSGGYPGPGLLPSDGRTFFVSVGAKF